jgi:hypothetical protein
VLANKGAIHVRVHVEFEKHKTAVGAETSSSKVTSFFSTSRRKSDGVVLTAEGAFASHSVKQQSNYKTSGCTSVLFRKYLLVLK